MNKHYKTLIFTDHALNRLALRSITKEMVYQVVSDPSKSYSKEDTTKFIRIIDNRKVHVVAQHIKDQSKWLVISVWVRGEDDTEPLVWRIITFPFWIVWKVIRRVIGV